jgi:hypothetical protein
VLITDTDFTGPAAGPGSVRETAVKTLMASSFFLVSTAAVTGLSFGGRGADAPIGRAALASRPGEPALSGRPGEPALRAALASRRCPVADDADPVPPRGYRDAVIAASWLTVAAF